MITFDNKANALTSEGFDHNPMPYISQVFTVSPVSGLKAIYTLHAKGSPTMCLAHNSGSTVHSDKPGKKNTEWEFKNVSKDSNLLVFSLLPS
jgi:hypothetical protein